MIITCENCESRFRFDESRIPPQGAQVRCSRCGSSFFVPFPEEETETEESPLDRLPAAEAVHDEEGDLLDRTLAEFHADLSASKSGIEPETEEHSAAAVQRSELFAAELEALGKPEDQEKEEVAVDDLDFARDVPAPGDETSTAPQSPPPSDARINQDQTEEDAEQDDSSMVGLLEPLAQRTVEEEEDLDGLGSPEEWDLIGDSRVELGGGEPPRSEDLSGSSLGLEDLFIPDSKRAEEPVQAKEKSLPSEEETASASAPPATEIGFDERMETSADRFSSKGVGMAKQVAGWAASLLLLCYAGYANLSSWEKSPELPPVYRTVQLEGMALRDVQVRQVENLDGSELLVVSGVLTRDPSRGSPPLVPVAILKGPVEKAEAAFGLALPMQMLRTRDPGEIQALLEASGRAFARQPRTGRSVPVEAVFEMDLAEPRQLQIVAQERAAIAETATSTTKTESLPPSLLPSSPTE